MAIVYSLICWGGRTGKVVTMTIASPCVVSSTAHGLRDGTGLVLSTSGVLPTGITAGTTYYAKSTAANTFNLYDTAAHAIAGGATGRVNTSGTQSGTHTAQSKVMLDYLASPPTTERWGSAGSERCYDGLASFNSAHSGALPTDEEYCELGEAFYDIDAYAGNYGAGYTDIKVPSAKLTISSRINGVRTAAYHNGVFNTGFIFTPGYYGCRIYSYDTACDGFSFANDSGRIGGMASMSPGSSAVNMLMYSSSKGDNGIVVRSNNTVFNCVVNGYNFGINIVNNSSHFSVCNNTVVKCNRGFYAESGYENTVLGYFYNNIALGNSTANWGTSPTLDGASTNAGLSGEAWGTNKITIATTDFSSYGAATPAYSDNFRALNSTSPQVDSGVVYYGAKGYDVIDAERPNYNNGGAEAYDIGAYEFDHGYGPHPASHVLTLTNVVTGSRVHVSDQAGTVTHYDDIAAASTVVITQAIYGDSRDNWRIRVRNASSSPSYQPYETLMTASAGSSSLYIAQITDE